MQVGKRVTYEDSKGNRKGATVTAVSGTGETGRKILDVTFDGKTAKAVPHAADSEKGEAFWLLETETDSPPERRVPLAKQPMALAAAAESGKLPEQDRRSEEAPAAGRKRKK